jgi:hypothetical protein
MSLFLVLLFSLALVMQATDESAAGEARVHGFFVQPSLGYGATDYKSFSSQGEYDSWVQSMADVGAEMLFYQWTVHYEKGQTWFSDEHGGSPDADFAFYNPTPLTINGIETRGWVTPTNWTGSPNQGGKEPVAYVLDAAQKAGIQVWLGLYLNEESSSFSWWDAVTDEDFSAADRAAIEHHVLRSIAVVNDLAAQYGDHPALGGIYYSIEVANNAFTPAANHPYLASIIDRVAKAVHQALPGKRLAISPFFNTALDSAEQFGAMWDYVLKNSELDIIILQDGVGVEPQTLTTNNDQVSDYFRAVRKAANAAGKPLWGNVELFTNLGDRNDPQLISASIDKVRLQLRTAAPYVDKFVCFEFHYMDPNDNYTFYKPLGGSAATDSAMRQTLYDNYMLYWQNWQEQAKNNSALPAILHLL